MFLLIVGSDYYPGSGTSDWVGTYSSRENAGKAYEDVKRERKLDENYSWYEIVDLSEWIQPDNVCDSENETEIDDSWCDYC